MNLAQVEGWLDEFSDLITNKDFTNKVVLAGSFPHLYEISNFCLEHEISCAAQDVSVFGQGAHTGYVASFQIKDYCQYCLVGHSEREEPEEVVKTKRDVCLKEDLTPVVCFSTKEKVKEYSAEGALLAWEDPENISQNGVYKEKDPAEIISTYKYFQRELPSTQVIYGGSVHRENVRELAEIPNLGGVLIGNASLDPQHFIEIISSF